MCVCHLHAPHARAVGIAGKPLKPVFLHGSFLCTGVPTWNNPRLVVNDAQASDLSKTLAGHRVAQMRGHGTVVAGESAEEAFFACTFLEENAQIMLQADVAGGAIPLSDDEARDCAEGTFNPRLFDLLWKFYERKVAL
jgi:ribulose-5-phosphate 4-epimerase/fuculose-1-phosphate aldolase